MSDLVILQALEGSGRGERILDEFERRTGLDSDARDDGRHYELHGEDHRTRIVGTLTDIDASWGDHIGLRMPM
jgi:hypothetical protein